MAVKTAAVRAGKEQEHPVTTRAIGKENNVPPIYTWESGQLRYSMVAAYKEGARKGSSPGWASVCSAYTLETFIISQ